MTPLFKKLNLSAASVIHILGAPESFEAELNALKDVRIERDVAAGMTFAIAFVVTLADVERSGKALTANAAPDATLWMAYPKASSRKYRCEFNRDQGWESLGAAGFEPVRQVAIDDDWSALRFRRVEHIKSMHRNPEGAISNAGRQIALASRAAKSSST
jgi:hypothetical protein